VWHLDIDPEFNICRQKVLTEGRLKKKGENQSAFSAKGAGRPGKQPIKVTGGKTRGTQKGKKYKAEGRKTQMDQQRRLHLHEEGDRDKIQ